MLVAWLVNPQAKWHSQTCLASAGDVWHCTQLAQPSSNCCCWLASSPAAHQTVCKAARAAAAGCRNRRLSCKHIPHWIALKSSPLAARQEAGCQVRSWCRRHQQRCQGGHRYTRSVLLLTHMLHCLQLRLQLQERLHGCSCGAGRCLQLAAACTRPICKCCFNAPYKNTQD
jgi:hypothetical protein